MKKVVVIAGVATILVTMLAVLLYKDNHKKYIIISQREN